MSRSHNSRKGSGSHPKHSCWCCTKRPPDERRRRESLAPSVAEQLSGMCTCPPCQAGYERLCFASKAIGADARFMDPAAWCAGCGQYSCSGVGDAAFCEVA